MSTPAPQPENTVLVEPALQAVPEDFHKGWRQVRLFTRDVQKGNWYAHLLGTVVKPFADEFPEMPFFISQYSMDEKADDKADTKFEELPQEFLIAVQQNTPRWHISLRIRFRPRGKEEEFLKAIIAKSNLLWFSHFLEFGMPGGLADTRFSTAQDDASRIRRGRLTANLLAANSRLILDSLICENDQWSFQANDHGLNQPFGLAAQSALHMVVNPWALNNSQPLPIYVRFNDTYFARL
jgi:hypothetical protein